MLKHQNNLIKLQKRGNMLNELYDFETSADHSNLN